MPSSKCLVLIASNLMMVVSLAQSNTSYKAATSVLAIDFPDPAIVEAGSAYYAFSTSGNGKNIQVAMSSSFTEPSWHLLDSMDVLPDPGSWANGSGGNIWAPDVLQLKDGRWVMYYAAPSLQDDTKHCIGAATSTSMLGPFQPADEPLACPLEAGGAIDPAAFVDPNDDNLYVVYKVDGNSINTGGGPCNGGGDPTAFHSTPIMVQQVDSSNGMTPLGKPFQILDRNEADGPLIEAPSLFYNNESQLYFLTFSSNCYSTSYYDISFAYSSTLENTFVKSKQPLMTSESGPVLSPGGADMTADGRFALFHGTVDYIDGEPVRHLFAAESMQAGCDMSAWAIS